MLLGHPAALAVLADDSGGEAKKAGPIALLVILLLAVACYFLFRSMTRHLRRVRDDFPDDGADHPDDGADRPDSPRPPDTDQQVRTPHSGDDSTPPAG